MAIKFEDLQTELKAKNNLPLNEPELTIIRVHEQVIDRGILRQFAKSQRIQIELEYFIFSDIKYSDFNHARKTKMKKELMFRYENAGWKLTIEYGEYDGPKRPGFDYMILTGKEEND